MSAASGHPFFGAMGKKNPAFFPSVWTVAFRIEGEAHPGLTGLNDGPRLTDPNPRLPVTAARVCLIRRGVGRFKPSSRSISRATCLDFFQCSPGQTARLVLRLTRFQMT